jgi:phosphotransferase system enzyme I (PtsP)
VQDVKDLGRRLVRNLQPGEEDGADYRGRVIVAGELMPSDILKLSAQKAEGLVLVSGGVTSHVAILARSLQLPMVIRGGPPPVRLCWLQRAPAGAGWRPGQFVRQSRARSAAQLPRIDGRAGRVHGAGGHARCAGHGDPRRHSASACWPTSTCSARRAKAARELKAEGVGLYRSEFPFIVRNDFPSEEEQYRIYRKLLDEMPGKPVVIRTLDVGGDKMLSYFPTVNEANPFLGLRAIRFSLRYKDIFTPVARPAAGRAGHRPAHHVPADFVGG